MHRIVHRLSALAFAGFLIGLLISSTAHAQTPAQATAQPDALFATIQSLDTQLFDAYNHCDLKAFGSLLAEDLEFYHDKTGLMRGRHPTVDAVQKNICGKVTRELVPGTFEVYPIANYGAVEIGVHRFHHPGDKGTEGVGEAKFIHLWQETDGTWKVTRVISFDHGAAN
jgi:ketosteroid isomerase-like protein